MKKNIFILFSFLLAACSEKDVKQNVSETNINSTLIKLTEAQFKSAGIKTGMLEQKNISTQVKLNGKIDVPPQNLISISVPLGGYLKSTKLLPGMPIKKGEIIAVLEDQQYIQLQQDYLITKIKLQTAEYEYKRQKELNESKASSDKVFQQANAEYLSSKVSVGALSEKLQLININPLQLSDNTISRSINLFAPFDGFVSKVNVNVGKYVNPSDVLFELVNPNDIHLNLKVFEKDLVKLKVGQQLWAYTNIHPEKKYKCEILEISKDISDDRTAEVHSHFENYDNSLLPGMYMNAEVELNDQTQEAIAEEAVLTVDGKKYVFMAIGPFEYQMVEVICGESENNFIAIQNAGELKNKKLVVKGAYTLLMALKNKAEE